MAAGMIEIVGAFLLFVGVCAIVAGAAMVSTVLAVLVAGAFTILTGVLVLYAAVYLERAKAKPAGRVSQS